MLASAACLLAGWTILATASTAFTLFVSPQNESEVARLTRKYERLMADRDARLDSAVAKLSSTAGSVDELAKTMERRHAALAQVFLQFRGVPGAQEALAPAPATTARNGLERILSVRLDQERMVARAETFARSRAERLRLAMRLAGLTPSVYEAPSQSALGGPLVDASDPKALATVLDVDEGFAARLQHAVSDLSSMRALQDAQDRLPFSRPAYAVSQTSGFGVRVDPFTGRPALHTGLDFSGPFLTPIRSTAPGIVSFTGVRTGYGNTIEIDHGGGFKTRYAHLAAISVHIGERVAVGQRIGAMGSTGRSTGVHLHYEVWVNGVAKNPVPFVKAGDYVQQN